MLFARDTDPMDTFVAPAQGFYLHMKDVCIHIFLLINKRMRGIKENDGGSEFNYDIL
jgi:hypothetical protein